MADRIPLDMRRLATQLRRMKDRSGLTVPALAARTAHPAEAWQRVLAGRQLPPLDAVEVLAQASGADYDRIGALWRLAEKASTGSGDRTSGRPVPRPDPLDPLSPEEGLPRRGRRVLLLAVAGALAVAALVAVLMTAGSTAVRSPTGDAGSTPGGMVGAPGSPGRPATGADSRGGTAGPGGAPDSAVPRRGGQDRTGPDGSAGAGNGPGSGPDDRPSTTASPSARPTATAGGSDDPSGSGAGGGAGRPGDSGGGTSAPGGSGGTGAGSGGTATPTPGGTAPGTAGTPAPTPTATPTPSKLCVGLIVLGICIG